MTDHGRTERERLVRTAQHVGRAHDPRVGIGALIAMGMLVFVSLIVIAAGLADDIRATRARVERCIP